jgi:hypothetical protein
MKGMKWPLIALVLFSVTFGYVEAVVVIYLRQLYEPIHQRLYPGSNPGDLFPVIGLADLEKERPDALRLVGLELGRESATLLMLAAMALAVARNFRQWFAGFMIAFGVWDISFYLFLKMAIHWPGSVWDWDLLFLLPVIWAGPVLSPVLVSLSMIGAGLVILLRESMNRPVPISWGHWSLILGGGALVIVAFCWDYRNISAGGKPEGFPWPLFWLGEGIGLGALGHSVWKPTPKVNAT